METRAIVYSFFKKDNQHLGLNDTYHYDELRYSIDTLRSYNKDIPIYLYLSPQGILDKSIENNISLRHDNIIVRYFDNTFNNPENWHPKFSTEIYWHFLYHRWRNAINCLLCEPVDRILFLDGDTILHTNVEILFDLYNDTSVVYAMPDNSSKLLKLFNITPAMNDGQFLLSKSIAEELDKNLDLNQQRIIKYLLDYPDPDDLPNKAWTSIQFAMYLLCREKNIPVEYFDSNHIMLSNDPLHKNRDQLILHHYFSNNRKKFLPDDYIKKIK
jgi:hypothetical protein